MYYCEQDVTMAVLTASSPKNASNDKLSAAVAKQEAMLRDKPDVIVSTPASLLTHLNRGGILQQTLRHSVETLVIDEADLVLSFGYNDDITEIIKFLPNIFQGFLMSATLSPELESLKKLILHSPVILRLEEEEEASNAKGLTPVKQGLLTQFYLSIPKKDKYLVVYVFLKLGLLKGKGLFFVNTTDGGYRLKLLLEQFHIHSAVLNSEVPLMSRLNIINQFNAGNFDYLIATDESAEADSNTYTRRKYSNDLDSEQGEESIQDERDVDHIDSTIKRKRHSHGKKKDLEYGVSRGLDFRGVSFVVNFDLPTSPSSYTHRIGRTARGGAKGVALSLVENESVNQHAVLTEIQKEQPPLLMSHALGSTETLRGSNLDQHDESSFTPTCRPQPTPLDFDLSEIEGFRYRVEDVSRAVTKVAIKETRLAELRAEILNSQRLQSHFEENKADLQLLRHDRLATHISKVQDHLK
jgi:ATP-dependent RNA helicase DDX56/DBP9